MVFEKLESNTLRLRIADKFREAILNGSLTEGERIVERKLATLFGSSLTAVREALIQLESEGLVTKKPNAATFVIKLTPELCTDSLCECGCVRSGLAVVVRW